MNLFDDYTPPERKKFAPIDPPEKRRQRTLFSGLHLFAGQQDLFPTDGHEEDTPAPEDLPELTVGLRGGR